jgi:hypothetical protein
LLCSVERSLGGADLLFLGFAPDATGFFRRERRLDRDKVENAKEPTLRTAA